MQVDKKTMVIEAESLGLIADHPNKLHGLRVQGISLPWYLLSCQPFLSLSMSGLCSSRAGRLLSVCLGWLENLSFFCIEMGTLYFIGAKYFYGSPQVFLEHSLEDAFCLPLLETYVPSCSLHSATSPNPSLPPMGTKFFICGPQTLEQPAGKY